MKIAPFELDSPDRSQWFAPVAFAMVASAAFVAGLSGIWDPDFFHHLAVGRAILRGTSVSIEPFLYPVAGEAVGIPQYWLGSILVYLASVPAGPAGSIVLVGVVAALLLTVLLVDALDGRREPSRILVAAGILALVLPEFRVRSAPRPELFANVLLAYTLLASRRFEVGQRRLLVAFPLVALLWTQVHVSVALGLGVVAILVGWSAVRLATAPRGGAAPPVDLRTPGLVLVAGLAATALTPSVSPLRLAWQFLLSTAGLGGSPTDGGAAEVIGVLRQHIEELQAPSLLDWVTRPFGLLVAVALASFLLHRSRGWVRELATVLAFAAFAATAFRFTAFAAYVAAPIAARNLSGWLEGARARRPAATSIAAALVACGGVVLAAVSPVLRAYPVGVGMLPGAFPVRAAEYLRELGFDGRMYNDFGSGGYFEWVLDKPVFQDGRGFMKPADLRDSQPEPVDPARMASLDARHRFDALVISTELPTNVAPSLLAKVYGGRDGLADRTLWSLVAFDDRAAVYLRRNGRYAARAASDEYHSVAPGTPRVSLPVEAQARDQLARELGRAARESPACVRCRVDLVDVLLGASRSAEAAPVIAELRALDHPRYRAQVEILAAAVARRRGDLAAAEESYRAAIEAADDPTTPRRVFAYFLVERGRLQEAAELVQLNLRHARDAEDLDMAVELARRSGDAERATALWSELVVARRRAFAAARVEDGIALVHRGRGAEALGAFQEAITADERSAEARTQLGLLLLGMGEPDAARMELARAVQLDPTEADAWLGLAEALEKRGDAGGAAAAYARFVALAPADARAAAARARVVASSRK